MSSSVPMRLGDDGSASAGVGRPMVIGHGPRINHRIDAQFGRSRWQDLQPDRILSRTVAVVVVASLSILTHNHLIEFRKRRERFPAERYWQLGAPSDS